MFFWPHSALTVSPEFEGTPAALHDVSRRAGTASPIPLDAGAMRTERWGVPRILLGLALLALGGCAASSRRPSQDDAVDEGALFEIIDRDQNGTVTEEEFVRVYEDRPAARREFERLDTNRDGVLSRDEFGSLRLFLIRW